MKFLMRQNPTFLFVLLWLIGIYSVQVETVRNSATSVLSAAAFTLMWVFNIFLYWFGVTRRVQNKTSWLCILGLMVSVFAMSMVSHAAQWGLYLALLVEATSILGSYSPRWVPVGILGCIAISFLSTYIQHKPFLFSFILQFMFVGGYTVMYIQQVHSNRQAQELLDNIQEAHRKLEIAHAQLSDYAVRVEELTLVAERQRLARELHDTLSQGLAGIILQLEAGRSHLANDRNERASEIISQTIGRARSALSDARGVLDDLRASGTSPSDLVEAIDEEVNRFVSTTDLEYSGDIAELSTIPAKQCDFVLKFITESLSNIARHAHARRVWVVARKHPDRLTIEVRDDGIGFDPDLTASLIGHYGLLGIRERARVASGHLDIVSSPGMGTTLRLCLPIQEEGTPT